MAAGALKSWPGLPWEAHAAKTQPGLCWTARTGHLSALPIFLDRNRPFLLLLPHEAEMLLKEADERGNPNQRHLQGVSALGRRNSAVDLSPDLLFPGCAVFG